MKNYSSERERDLDVAVKLAIAEFEQDESPSDRSQRSRDALVSRLRAAIAAPTGISEASLESIPVGSRLTTECPTCKRQVLSQDIEPFADKCKDCRIAALESALERLVSEIEIDHSLIHSERCDCELCKSIRGARTLLDNVWVEIAKSAPTSDEIRAIAPAPAADCAEETTEMDGRASASEGRSPGLNAPTGQTQYDVTFEFLMSLADTRKPGNRDASVIRGIAKQHQQKAAELQKLREENEAKDETIKSRTYELTRAYADVQNYRQQLRALPADARFQLAKAAMQGFVSSQDFMNETCKLTGTKELARAYIGAQSLMMADALLLALTDNKTHGDE